MNTLILRYLILVALLLSPALSAPATPVVIGHPDLRTLDRQTLQRIYTGKVIEVDGARVTPVNLPPNNSVRRRFLELYLDQNNDKYVGYWTVRRYVGKGTPPPELDKPQDVINFVNKTQGAIGYIDRDDLEPNLHILLTAP